MHRDAALQAWRALVRDAVRGRGETIEVLEGPGGDPASLWPLVQVLWAAAEVVALGETVDLDVFRPVLRLHRDDDGYAATPGGRRFFDDNAWLGLASLRLLEVTGHDVHRRRAARTAAFVRRGEARGGGVRWAERSPSRNACSTAAAAWLALAASPVDPDAAAFARRSMAWLVRTLRRPDGLLADRIVRGSVVDTAWSYNQGAAIAAWRRLGEANRAGALAAAALDRFRDERLWREPPAFSCILFRALLEDPDPTTIGLLDAHLERLVLDARDPVTGWYTAGGVGTYDGRPTIDQAAIVQMLAFRSRPEA
jgi:hypothetical protein